MNPQPQPSNALIAASWITLLAGLAAFIIGLWNAQMPLSEKGFYAMSFLLSLFAAIAVQKNTRDAQREAPRSDIQ